MKEIMMANLTAEERAKELMDTLEQGGGLAEADIVQTIKAAQREAMEELRERVVKRNVFAFKTDHYDWSVSVFRQTAWRRLSEKQAPITVEKERDVIRALIKQLEEKQ